MDLDPLVLSRIQFAFVVSFHAIFPVFTIGLASYIALIYGLAFKTNNPKWERLGAFWTQVFAVVFGMGVVSGIVMSFQFGTNWSNFALATSNFLGPILSYEVVTAFFLEAAFLGVLLFGRGKVPNGVHFFAALMVSIGTFISSFWILSANSWMQTPAGVEMRDGFYHVIDWSAAIFNDSFWYRFSHMALASFLTGGFVVAGVSAWFILEKRDTELHRKALSMTLWLLLIIAPLQIFVGDMHGLNTLKHQPTKVAAMGMLANEGSYDRMQKFFEAGIHPCDIILLMACEEGDTPKIEELIKAGADTSVKDWQGKTCMELAANDKVWRATDATPPLVRHRCPMHLSLTP